MILTGESRSNRCKTYPIVTLSTTNSGMTPRRTQDSLAGGRLANQVSYVEATNSHKVSTSRGGYCDRLG
jgi:hypothetical protein